MSCGRELVRLRAVAIGMTTRFAVGVCCLAMLSFACRVEREPTVGGVREGRAGQPLKLERVRFFEAGVGYFERVGAGVGGSAPTLIVPDAHLDDALRTLVVLSGAAPAPPALEFESVVLPELARERAALASDGAHPDFREVLESLVGLDVEIERRSKRAVGRLVAVSDAPTIPLVDPEPNGPTVVPSSVDDLYLTVAGRDAGVERFRASEIRRIRATDPERRALLDRALDDTFHRGIGARRSLRIVGASGALRVGYLAEAPVWRPSYRLFVSDAGRAKLTASALVHNDTDEAWSGVRVTFSGARPDSFLSELAAPAYDRREAVRELGGLSSLPQLGFAVRSPAPSTRSKSAAGPANRSTRLVKSDPRSPPASGTFEYPSSESIAVRAHGSALVPFLDTTLEATPVVTFSAPGALGKRAVRVVNTTDQTLPEGTLSVFTSGVFSGEAVLPRLLPKMSSLVRFADALEVKLELATSAKTSTVTSVTFDGETFERVVHQRHERTLVVENRGARPVSVYLWLGLRTTARTQGFERLDEESKYGVLDAPGAQTLRRVVVVETDDVSQSDTANVTSDELRELVNAPELPPAVRGAVRAALAVAERIAENASAVEKAEQRSGDLENDVSSARSDLADLAKDGGPATAPLVARYLAAQREHERAGRYVSALREDGERLVTLLRRELARLPKPKPKP